MISALVVIQSLAAKRSEILTNGDPDDRLRPVLKEAMTIPKLQADGVAIANPLGIIVRW